jgi:hypothetical protein
MPGKTMPGKGTGGMAGPAGTGGMMMPDKGMGGMMGGGMKPGMTGAAGAIVIGVPTPGQPGTVFPGGGPNGSTPLKPGCTPASAHECPSASGACATSSTSNPSGTTTGSICFWGPITTTTTTTTTPAPLAATIEYLHETAGGKEYYRFRITFDPTFVDNTYGVNAIGWGTKGHTFKDLVGSDHAELSLFDGTKTMVSMFDIDYITANSTSACLYGALGVSGGEGKMLVGDSKYILASTTSLDRDLNGCGYCKNAACGGDCTVDSPATDANYTPNPAAPNWDFRVVYEVWVDAGAFGSNGFGGAAITFVHASPSKASSNTVSVTPRPCDGGGCPEGAKPIQTANGIVCSPGSGSCPEGATPIVVDGGIVCSPGSSGCPEGATPIKTDAGITCSPGGTGCPPGTYPIETPVGTRCSPCPDGQRPVEGSSGTTCEACPAGTTLRIDTTGYSCVAIVVE